MNEKPGHPGLRVLMVNKYGPEVNGGVEVHVDRLARSLVATGEVEVDSLAVSSDPAVAETTITEPISGYRIILVPQQRVISSTPFGRGFDRTLAELSREADIVHAHFPYPAGDRAFFAAERIEPSLKDKPLIITFHADVVRQKALLAFYRPLMRSFFSRSSAIITSSPQLAHHAELLEGFRDRVNVIPFGVDTERFCATDEALARGRELAEGIGIPAGTPIVLFVGRLVYYKGVEVLLDAVARMERHDAHLVIGGVGPLAKQARGRTARLNIADVTRFIGAIPDDDLVPWLSVADVLAFPSVATSEAFGLVQTEAHSCGTPTVTSALPTGVSFATQHEEDGLLVTPGDADELARALDLMVEDDRLRERLGTRARERVLEEFTLESMAQATIGLYRTHLRGA